jgi:hypothetical protein
MKRFPAPRKTANLSESVQQQLNRYAVAAIAAGVGVMALAEPSDAKVVYTPVYKVIKPGTNYDLDLNHDGITDFTLRNYAPRSSRYIALTETAPKSNSVAGFKEYTNDSGGYVWCASKLGGDKGIGPRRKFTNQALVLFYEAYVGGYLCETHIPPRKNRYLGTRFQVNGESHYGWVRLSIVPIGELFKVVLTGYAYETVPNKRIITGSAHDSDGTEQPASMKGPVSPAAALGLLALGAPGLSIWRREQSVSASAFR